MWRHHKVSLSHKTMGVFFLVIGSQTPAVNRSTPENGRFCIVLSIICCIHVFQPDIPDFSMLALSNTICHGIWTRWKKTFKLLHAKAKKKDLLLRRCFLRKWIEEKLLHKCKEGFSATDVFAAQKELRKIVLCKGQRRKFLRDDQRGNYSFQRYLVKYDSSYNAGCVTLRLLGMDKSKP